MSTGSSAGSKLRPWPDFKGREPGTVHITDPVGGARAGQGREVAPAEGREQPERGRIFLSVGTTRHHTMAPG